MKKKTNYNLLFIIFILYICIIIQFSAYKFKITYKSFLKCINQHSAKSKVLDQKNAYGFLFQLDKSGKRGKLLQIDTPLPI